MNDLEPLEQELRDQIDRRLEPGERTQLLKLAGQHFTLGFEFGKDWVRLRKVKRRRKPPSDEAKQLDELKAEVPVTAAATSTVVSAAKDHAVPEAPWQAIGDGRFQFGKHELAVLQPEANGHWQFLADDKPIATALPLNEAVSTAQQWLRSQLQESRDTVEFARVQLEVMQDNANEAAIAEQQAQVTDMELRHERLQAAVALIEIPG